MSEEVRKLFSKDMKYVDALPIANYINDLQQRIDKAIEYINKYTKYYDVEFSKIYGKLCDIPGAGDTRIHVVVGDKELLSILKGKDKKC